MTVVSSLRAFRDCREFAINQKRAHESWQKIFSEIIYFGHPEPALSSPKTRFFPCEDFPNIRTLAATASSCPPYSCIVNSDIVLSHHLPMVINQLIRLRAQAAVSRRYEFEGECPENGKLVHGDWGVDFFWATTQLWRRLSEVIPEHFRIGHTSWDTYTMSFFNTVAHPLVWDITPKRVVFHPKHGSRRRPHFIKTVDDIYTLKPGMPRAKLR